MNIGLLDIDNQGAKRPHPYPNIALAKIARHYRSLGANVEWATPFAHYDAIFASKIFNFTPPP